MLYSVCEVIVVVSAVQVHVIDCVYMHMQLEYCTYIIIKVLLGMIQPLDNSFSQIYIKHFGPLCLLSTALFSRHLGLSPLVHVAKMPIHTHL